MITETIEIDYTLVQMLIKSVKEGNLDNAKNLIEKYHMDVTLIKDVQNDQNCLFHCTLIKDEEK